MAANKAIVDGFMEAVKEVQDEMGAEQKAFLAQRSSEYKAGYYSGKEFSAMACGAQIFSAKLAAKLAKKFDQ